VTLGNNNGTDRQTDGQTECDAICGPLLKEEGRIIKCIVGLLVLVFNYCSRLAIVKQRMKIKRHAECLFSK